MRICYFGIYDPNYVRNRIILSCLRRAGYTVEEINTRGGGLRNYWYLYQQLRHKRNQYDAVVVGFPGQQAVIVAWLAFRGPIVFNTLLSLYDSIINDRRQYSRFSWRAAYFWMVDYLSAHLSTAIILDCNAYIDFFVSNFRVSRTKCTRIFLGAQEELLRPIAGGDIPYEIHYYSTFIPTHGTDTIIRAAKLLEGSGVTFIFSGAGQCLARDQALAKESAVDNVTFVPRCANLDELNRFINSSWVSLGLFGQNARTERCIGSKVFEQLYCGRPIVTNNTRATRELLEDGVSALLVPPNDPQSLAEALRTLKQDDTLRKAIATRGQAVYAARASQAVLTSQLRELFESVVPQQKNI